MRGNPFHFGIAQEAILPLLFIAAGLQPRREQRFKSPQIFGVNAFAPVLIATLKTAVRQAEDVPTRERW